MELLDLEIYNVKRTRIRSAADLQDHTRFLGPSGCSRAEYREDLRVMMEAVMSGQLVADKVAFE
jgi:hypothetical protein